MVLHPPTQDVSAGPPLLLLPGTLCDERIFAPLQERFQTGRSDVVLAPAARSVRQAAEQVLASAPPSFALLGFSLGGIIAMETALLAPERVLGLALLSTTPRPVAPDAHQARRAAIQECRVQEMPKFVSEHLWPEYRSPMSDPASLELLQAMASSLGHTVFADQTELALGRKDYRGRLSGVTCPTLILAGMHDQLCPPDVQRELAASIQGSVLIVLPHAGHLALLEKPDEVATAVAAWFQTIPQRHKSSTEHASARSMAKEME